MFPDRLISPIWDVISAAATAKSAAGSFVLTPPETDIYIYILYIYIYIYSIIYITTTEVDFTPSR